MRYITPEHVMSGRFENREKPKWDIAVLCFRGHRGSAALVQKLGATPVGYKTLWGMDEPNDCPFVYEARIGTKRIGVVSRCVWGGPQSATLVEELAHLGVPQLIGFGAAGSIVPYLEKGTMVVGSTGIVTDGTSRAYTEEHEISSNFDFCSIAQEVGKSLGVDVAPVRIATVDAIYREKPSDVQVWRDRGAQAINMETTPMYAASVVCGVKSVWVGHISDCLRDHKWEAWERDDAETETSVKIVSSMLEAISG